MDVLTKKRLFDIIAESEREYRILQEQKFLKEHLNQEMTPTPSITPSITLTPTPTITISLSPTSTPTPTPTPSCTPIPSGIIGIAKIKLQNLSSLFKRLF